MFGLCGPQFASAYREGFRATLPRCCYPGQVTTTAVNTRSGPGTAYTNLNQPLQGGALAYVACQKSGSLVGTTSVWNQLVDGRWVTRLLRLQQVQHHRQRTSAPMSMS